ncbi:tRNA (adenosine(37)-N6)-threonylcarbamoyltransferase complex dimerization subunit type 1 TsaB [Elongatibacter sediminis]|uniref:tRNA threonylcarbamoyladenosine biosynthesis protein TsaB n=1 Tax=Elongatibacter sediminis TaxID=3119006 RepID=A0AAW9RH66_9GAMM
MKRLLAIETSSEACSVALAEGSNIHEQHAHAPLKHAELLLASVRTVLAQAGLRLTDLDAVVFGRGPGSFTSLRIGIGAVQGLAWGAGLPVVPVSSLAAVAVQALDRGAENIVVAMDARMDEVFTARFAVREPVPAGTARSAAGTADLELLGAERVCDPAEIRVEPVAETIGCGNGFERYPALRRLGVTLKEVRPDLLPRASALIPLARTWLETQAPLPAQEAQPVYVRDHVADKPARNA